MRGGYEDRWSERLDVATQHIEIAAKQRRSSNETLRDKWGFKVLASYPEGEDIQLPLNIMFQDSAGLSARVSVGGTDVPIGGPLMHEEQPGH